MSSISPVYILVYAIEINQSMTSRSVIWITIESTRADHTFVGGYHRKTTPNIAEFALKAQSFGQCFSHSIWTRPSTASILTGYAPSAHQTWSNDAKLPTEIATVTESFRDAGYLTKCISSNGQVSPGTGLDRGFEDFQYLSQSTLVDEVGFVRLFKWLFSNRQHSGGLTVDGRQHSLGYLVNSLAKNHISKAASNNKPLFLYLHHNDIHHAYVPPVTWRNRFFDDVQMTTEEGISLVLNMSYNLHKYIAQDQPFSDSEWKALTALYDASIAYVDHLVGDLIRYAQRLLDDPLIVVTSDHGELLGERGLLAHMLVTNTEVSNVPLIIGGMDDIPEGGLIQHADVMEMICTDLGIDHHIPVGQDIREQPREFAVTQRSGIRARNKLKAIQEHNEAFDLAKFHQEDLTSIRTKEWRYQTSGERAELFALPEETKGVSDSNPEVVQRLKTESQEWFSSVGKPVGDVATPEFDERTTQHLRDMGYLQ